MDIRKTLKNIHNNITELVFLLPFLIVSFYGFGDLRIVLFIYFLPVFIFSVFIFFLDKGSEIYLPYGYIYILIAIIVSAISFIFSPIKHLIIIDYIGFLLGFVIFLLLIQNNTEEKMIYIYPFLFFIAIYALYTGIVNKGEFTSTLNNSNTLAFISILILGMTLEKKKYYISILFIIIIILTKSIGALLSLMLTSFYYAFKNRENIDFRKNYLIIIIMFIIFIFFVFHIDPNSVYDRIRWWKFSIDMFLERPLTGWGYSSFTYIGERYISGDLKSIYTHNYFIEVLSDFGVLFFIPWLYFLYMLLKLSRGFYNYTIIAALICSFFDFGPNTVSGWWFFMYIAAKSLKDNLYIFRITEDYKKIKLFVRIYSFFLLISFIFFSFKYFDLYIKNIDIVNQIEKKDYQIALKLCDDTLKKHPLSIDIVFKKYEIYSYYYAITKDPKDLYGACEALEYIVFLNPYSARIYNVLENLYSYLGDYKSLDDLSKRKKKYLKLI